MGIEQAAAQGFARAPEPYELGRPTYPAEAVTCLRRELELNPGRTVLDLAAGTGKLTALLVASGATVIAVEPVDEMRAVLERKLPGVAAHASTAESILLPDASVDAVTVGQAFHWFRGREALAEIHRVLRPGGRLGLIWNFRDETVPWVAELTRIMEPHRGALRVPRRAPGARRSSAPRSSGPLQAASFRHVHRLTPDGVVARVASVSFVAALAEPERAAVLESVRELLARDPDTRGRAEVELPYRTDVYWCARRG